MRVIYLVKCGRKYYTDQIGPITPYSVDSLPFYLG